MRQFASSGFRIWNLGREAKVIYTIFAAFALAAYVVSVLYYDDLMGLRTAGARGYYAGGAVESPISSRGGPVLELPDEAAHPVREPISYRHLLEVTHFHLFTVPVFLLIVAHLFMLTGLSPGSKLAWILGAGISALVHVAAPWWVRYGGGGAAVVMPVSGAAMLASFGFMTAYSIAMMWRVPARPADSSPP
jgi:hypothetical protein